MRPRTTAAMTVRAVGSTRSGAGHWQVMECNALSGGAAGDGSTCSNWPRSPVSGS